ncbi:hypothetical protein MRX96_009736 [Rhipicephalus microplus]
MAFSAQNLSGLDGLTLPIGSTSQRQFHHCASWNNWRKSCDTLTSAVRFLVTNPTCFTRHPTPASAQITVPIPNYSVAVTRRPLLQGSRLDVTALWLFVTRDTKRKSKKNGTAT